MSNQAKIDYPTFVARARAIVDSMNYTRPEAMSQRIIALTKLFEEGPDGLDAEKANEDNDPDGSPTPGGSPSSNTHKDFWQFGFSCCVTAICSSLEHLAATDGDVDKEVIRALIDNGADPARVRSVHEKIKTAAPLYLGLFVSGRLPLRAAFEQVQGSLELALEVGIEKAINLEECDG